MIEGVSKNGKVIIDFESGDVFIEDFEINELDYNRIIYKILLHSVIILNNNKKEARTELFEESKNVES
jgi:hypothetical protein